MTKPARRWAFLRPRETSKSVAAGALGGDAASRILPWTTALLAFLAVLALAAALAVGDSAARWSAGFGGGLTIQLGPAPAEGPDPAIQVLAMLAATPGVAEVTAVPEAEVDRLLTPWLGGLVDLAGLPKPRFLDATLTGAPAVDAEILEARLRQADPDVKVDDHQVWAERLAAYARAVARTALAAAALIGLISAAGVAAIATARMAIHRDAIRLMRLMGATDGWLAGVVARAALRQGFLGGLAGAAIALGAAGLVEWAAADVEGLVPAPRLLPWHWATLAATPLAVGLIAVLSARAAAVAWLRRA